MGLETLQEHVRIASFAIPLVLLAFALHEMAHAYTATWFGDPTPAQYGRRTLNPIRHLDPVGTIMICATMLLLGFPMGFAVTPVNDTKMRRPRLHGALVALAGPMVNVGLCALAAAGLTWSAERVDPASAFYLGASQTPLVIEAFYYAMVFNAFLAVFNLLPIPPLDGGRIVGSLLRPDLAREWVKIGEYGVLIVLGLAFLGGDSFQRALGELQRLLLMVIGTVTNNEALLRSLG